jgi:phage gpG-like protein
MAAAATVTVEGARELRATMKRAGEDRGDLKDAHAEVAAYVATAARAAAPIASGKLAATIRGNRAAASAVVKAGGAAVPYAGPIHWGWPARGIPAREFLTATAAETEPHWTETYLDAIRRIVDRIHGK